MIKAGGLAVQETWTEYGVQLTWDDGETLIHECENREEAEYFASAASVQVLERQHLVTNWDTAPGSIAYTYDD